MEGDIILKKFVFVGAEDLTWCQTLSIILQGAALMKLEVTFVSSFIHLSDLMIRDSSIYSFISSDDL